MLVTAAALATVGLVGWGALQLVDVFSGQETSDHAEAPEDCAQGEVATAQPARALPKPSAITVNVYNATTRAGLAQDTADELEKRGFKIGKVDNAPAKLDKKVDASGVLMGSARSYQNKSLSVLGAQIPHAETRTDQRGNDTVDLVIGNDFTKLAPRESATRTLTELASPPVAPSPSCRD